MHQQTLWLWVPALRSNARALQRVRDTRAATVIVLRSPITHTPNHPTNHRNTK